MIEGIIVFSAGGEEFAVDLQQVPVITKADNYFSDNPFANGINPVINFDNRQIELIDIHRELGLEFPGININSRIVLFERGFDYFGIIADEIKYILNIDYKSLPEEKSESFGFVREIHYGASVYKMLNLNLMTVRQS